MLGTSQPTTLYLYDGDGNLIRQVNPNNTETDYDYTNYWKPGGGEEIVTNKRTSDGTTLSQLTYTFDANRNKISELDQVMDSGEGASNTQLYTWAYDADGRLTDETFDNQSDAPDGSTNAVTTDDYHDHYDYDLNGNRVDEKIDTSADGGTGSSAVYDQVTSSRYDPRNELTSETQTTVATGTTVYSTRYLYDANGSILSSTRTDVTGTATTVYTYDARNRIATVSSGGSTTTYTYNDDGILVKQAVAGGDTTIYLIDANNPTGYSQVLEVSKNGGSVPTMTYTLGKTIIAQNSGGTISYIMPDGHGSTRQLTAFTTDASSGHVVARYDYDAFGNPITLTATTHAANTASTSVMYVGMLLDPITGSYRTQTREYTAADGRFFTQDTYMPSAGDTGNANLYVYVGGNPVNSSDPFGLFTQEFGELAHAVIAGRYQAEHPGAIVNPLSGVLSSLKPDIFDAFQRGYAEIKPLSFRGITSGLERIKVYDAMYGQDGKLRINFHRITNWPEGFETTVVDGDWIGYVNIDGLIFYTDSFDDLEELKQIRRPEDLYKLLRNRVKNQMKRIEQFTRKVIKKLAGEEEADLQETAGDATLNSEMGAP